MSLSTMEPSRLVVGQKPFTALQKPHSRRSSRVVRAQAQKGETRDSSSGQKLGSALLSAAFALSVGISVVAPPPAQAEDAYERRRQEMERRKELLAKTRERALALGGTEATDGEANPAPAVSAAEDEKVKADTDEVLKSNAEREKEAQRMRESLKSSLSTYEQSTKDESKLKPGADKTEKTPSWFTNLLQKNTKEQAEEPASPPPAPEAPSKPAEPAPSTPAPEPAPAPSTPAPAPAPSAPAFNFFKKSEPEAPKVPPPPQVERKESTPEPASPPPPVFKSEPKPEPKAEPPPPPPAPKPTPPPPPPAPKPTPPPPPPAPKPTPPPPPPAPEAPAPAPEAKPPTKFGVQPVQPPSKPQKVEAKSGKKKGPLPMTVAQILLLAIFGGLGYATIVKETETNALLATAGKFIGGAYGKVEGLVSKKSKS